MRYMYVVCGEIYSWQWDSSKPQNFLACKLKLVYSNRSSSFKYPAFIWNQSSFLTAASQAFSAGSTCNIWCLQWSWPICLCHRGHMDRQLTNLSCLIYPHAFCQRPYCQKATFSGKLFSSTVGAISTRLYVLSSSHGCPSHASMKSSSMTTANKSEPRMDPWWMGFPQGPHL
jgi:hypothetical protein